MNVGDRFDVTLDVAVVQVNNGRARLQFKTDNGTIIRFWYGVERLPVTPTVLEHHSYGLTGNSH
jgi:hypothetical protein